MGCKGLSQYFSRIKDMEEKLHVSLDVNHIKKKLCHKLVMVHIQNVKTNVAEARVSVGQCGEANLEY